jgi:hypothetical protein
MASDFIKIQRDQSAATEAAELLAWVRDARSVYERAIRIRDKMRHNFNDQVSPIDWSALETLWGVPTGKGQTVYTFLDGSVLAMTAGQQNSCVKDVTETVG